VVAISQQVGRRLIKRKCFSQLLCGPLRRRMGRYVEMHDSASVVSQHQRHIQLNRMVGTVKKSTETRLFTWFSRKVRKSATAASDGAPCTCRRWFSPIILQIRSPTSFETAGRPRRPRRSFQVQNNRKALRCQATTVSGLDDDESGTPVDPDLGQPNPEESIRGVQFRPLHRAMYNTELVTESEDLKLECGAAAEGRQKGSQEC
jgi:hypothetical protein